MAPAIGPDGQPIRQPSHAGRDNPSLDNTTGQSPFASPVATIHMPETMPAPQPLSADRGYPVAVPDDLLEPLEVDGDPSFAWTNAGGSRFRVDHDPTYDEPGERTLRVNMRTPVVVDYHPYADPIRDSDFDPHRTMIQRAYTIRDWFGPFLMDFTGAKSRPIVIAREPFGAGTMFAQDPRINRNRPFPETYGDQTGEPC